MPDRNFITLWRVIAICFVAGLALWGYLAYTALAYFLAPVR
jgi:hypothetical protein